MANILPGGKKSTVMPTCRMAREVCSGDRGDSLLVFELGRLDSRLFCWLGVLIFLKGRCLQGVLTGSSIK